MTGQVYRYGVQTGRCECNPAADVRGALKPHVPANFAAIVKPAEAGELLRAIDAYTGQPPACLRRRARKAKHSAPTDIKR